MTWKTIIFILFPFILIGQNKTIEGRIMTDDGEPAIFASVGMYIGDQIITGAETDIDGYYSMSASSIYWGTLKVSYTGYKSQTIPFYFGKLSKLDVFVTLTSGVQLEDIIVIDYKIPVIDQDKTPRTGMVMSERFRKLPSTNLSDRNFYGYYLPTSVEYVTVKRKQSAPLLTRGNLFRSISMINQSEVGTKWMWKE